MSKRTWTGALLALMAVVAAAVAAWQRSSPAPAAGAPLDDSVVSVRLRLGVNDSQPRPWDGSLTVSGGQLVQVRNWHPRPGDETAGSAWKLATRKGPNFVWRPWEREPLTGPVPYVTVPGVIVDVRGARARLRVQTKNGSFDVDCARLPATFLNGAVVADRVPAAQRLSADEGQHDFAAAVALPDGTVWTAWVAWRDGRNRILARRYAGGRWEDIREVTAQPGDIFLVKLGRDGAGRVWAVWSEQVNNNWDLYARRFDGSSWSAVERISEDSQPDIFHNVATDSNGHLWVVWQGFRGGKSDIFARRHDGTSWAAAERVSTSPANDWEPAVAAGGGGRVWVAWDTYDKGNYDIAVRSFQNGKWSGVSPIADTPKYEAHVALACDNQDRLWAAWDESGMQWGKDTGFLVKKEATPLYESRWISVAVNAGGGWQEPVAALQPAMPDELRQYNDLPQLVSDGAGRVWLFFRHRTLRIRDLPSNTPAHRAAWEIFATTYSGSRWAEPVAVPFSQGHQDMRAGFASDGRGNVWAAWPTDNRDFEEFLFQHADVYAARLPRPAGAAPEAPRLQPRVQPKLSTWTRHADEAGDLRRIRAYTIQSGGRTYRIYRGDTHRHSEFSMDGHNDGSLYEAYRYALDAAELDYLGTTEHNGSGGPDIPYINYILQQAADVFFVPGSFTPVFAYERSLSYPNGHRNVVFAKRGNPTLPIPPEEQKAKVGAARLYEYLRRYGGIAISHTSATGMGTDWRDNDPEVEPLVEIYQGDRVSAEYEGAPKAAHRGDPTSAPGGFRPLGYVWNAWAKGYKLGVQASSDHLSTHLSYACTIAGDFTRQGLLDAMKARHNYGATDNIVLDYRMQSGGREYIQGDIVKAPEGDVKLVVRVLATAPIRQIDVIRNNRFIHTRTETAPGADAAQRSPLEKEASFTYIDNQPLSGESYYYVRVIQADENIAWSSPIWITR